MRGDADWWAQEYERCLPEFAACTEHLERMVERLLIAESVDFAQIQSRVKAVKSFREKLERKDHKYENPLIDMTDLVGVRVVLYEPAGVGLVSSIVEREFKIDADNSRPLSRPPEPDRFGYSPCHYIVSMTDERVEQMRDDPFRQPEYDALANCIAEIQVRTLASHAWAVLDDKLQYKHDDLPAELQRRVARVNALLELADAEIDKLMRDARAVVHRETLAPVRISASSLASYMAESSTVEDWVRRALAAGWSQPTQPTNEATRAALLSSVRTLQVTTVGQLQELLEAADQWGDEALEVIAREAAAHYPPDSIWAKVYAEPESVVHALVLCSRGSIHHVRDSQFREDIKAALTKCVEGRG